MSIALTAARSMSRYSQVVLARTLVNRSRRPGVSFPCLTIVGADGLERRQAGVAAILDHDLEAAGGAQPVDRRGAEDIDFAVADFVLEKLLQLVGDHVGRAPLRGALVKLVEHDVHRAEVRRVGPQQQRLPGDGHRVTDAGNVAGQFLDRVHRLCGSCQRRRIGQADVDDQIALVVRGNEAGRRLGKHLVRQHHQPAVQEQDEHAGAQQQADRGDVAAGEQVEAAVEDAERRTTARH